ncbi:MAG: hypothetical protein V8Q27_05770 [Eubacteriales bacterium]
MTDRYLMPVYAFVYLIAVGGFAWLLGKLIRPGRALAVCSAVFLATTAGWPRERPDMHMRIFRSIGTGGGVREYYCVYIDREYNWWGEILQA